MTREKAMIKAIGEARDFCDNYKVAPYGDSFSEFRQKTVEMFFNKIYDESKNRNCENCKHLNNDILCGNCIYQFHIQNYKNNWESK